MPRATNNLPILIVKKKGQNNQSKDFKVNKNRVACVLSFLCRYNQSFINYGIKISEENLEKLPDDSIPDNMNIIDDTSFPDTTDNHIGAEILESENPKDDYETFVDGPIHQILEKDKIKQCINWPQASKIPINEFEFDRLASLLFPKLFPKGLGDPTKKARLRYVSETHGELIFKSIKSN